MDHPPAPEIAKAAQIAKLADPRNVVASGRGRLGSRGLICLLPPSAEALPARDFAQRRCRRRGSLGALARCRGGARRQGQMTSKRRRSTIAKAWRAHGARNLILMFMGDRTMAMTATERSRVLRERRASGKVVLTVAVSEDELATIARAGYAEAASTDRKARELAVSVFLSDAVWGLTQ
jgi:hypothetical protein